MVAIRGPCLANRVDVHLALGGDFTAPGDMAPEAQSEAEPEAGDVDK